MIVGNESVPYFQLDSGEDTVADSDPDQDERVGSGSVKKRYVRQEQVGLVQSFYVPILSGRVPKVYATKYKMYTNMTGKACQLRTMEIRAVLLRKTMTRIVH